MTFNIDEITKVIPYNLLCNEFNIIRNSDEFRTISNIKFSEYLPFIMIDKLMIFSISKDDILDIINITKNDINRSKIYKKFNLSSEFIITLNKYLYFRKKIIIHFETVYYKKIINIMKNKYQNNGKSIIPLLKIKLFEIYSYHNLLSNYIICNYPDIDLYYKIINKLIEIIKNINNNIINHNIIYKLIDYKVNYDVKNHIYEYIDKYELIYQLDYNKALKYIMEILKFQSNFL